MVCARLCGDDQDAHGGAGGGNVGKQGWMPVSDDDGTNAALLGISRDGWHSALMPGDASVREAYYCGSSTGRRTRREKSTYLQVQGSTEFLGSRTERYLENAAKCWKRAAETKTRTRMQT